MTVKGVSREIAHVQPIIKPKFTIPRPTLLDERDPVNAALAVGEFIGAPQKKGDWQINRFTINDQDLMRGYMRAHGDGKGRYTASKGEFLNLERQVEGEDGPELETVMSNTYQEMIDHADVLLNAWGHVLIHGLGLSCVVSGLLAKPEVEHIDVVEIDQDVIDMVGPAYKNEERVTIHQGDAYNFPWEPGRRWNYVWHDIWSDIRVGNLNDPEKAEFGITYAMLHRRFGQRADQQGSWAFKEALKVRAQRRRKDREQEEFNEAWRKADYDGRVNLLIDWQVKNQYSVPGLITALTRDQWVEIHGHEGMLMDHIRKVAKSSKPPLLVTD